MGFAGAVIAPALDRAARRQRRRAERSRARPAGSGTRGGGNLHGSPPFHARPAASGGLDAPLLGGSRLSLGWHGQADSHAQHAAAGHAAAAAHRHESRYNSDDSAASSPGPVRPGLGSEGVMGAGRGGGV